MPRFVILGPGRVPTRVVSCALHDMPLNVMGGETFLALGATDAVPALNGTVFHDEATDRFKPFESQAVVEALRGRWLAWVDAQAEAARGEGITAGAGQAEEYAATEAEARRFLDMNAVDFGQVYPMLEAERRALGGDDAPHEVDIAMAIIAKADDRLARLARIKEIRRTAKIAIAAARTVDELKTAAATAFPFA